MFEIKVPELAESITEGTISRWLKNVGELVQEGEPVVELETDKVNLEVPAAGTGVLTEVLRQKGETVKVGEVIGRLDENAAAAPQAAAPQAGGAPSGQPAPVTPPAAQPAPQPVTGVPAAAAANGTANVPAAPNSAKAAEQAATATPAARKLARERGIDLQQVSARDPLGRIGTEDVKNYTPGVPAPGATALSVPGSPAQQGAGGQPAQPGPVGQPDKEIERIPMSRRRLTIANRLLNVKNTTAMLTTFNEVDMTAIMDLRNRRKDKFQEKFNVKLGFMSFFVKAVVGA
ncbi:MAG TPA: biotin/lipoyl-containing protein, partial [Bacilli bacterium]